MWNVSCWRVVKFSLNSCPRPCHAILFWKYECLNNLWTFIFVLWECEWCAEMVCRPAQTLVSERFLLWVTIFCRKMWGLGKIFFIILWNCVLVWIDSSPRTCLALGREKKPRKIKLRLWEAAGAEGQTVLLLALSCAKKILLSLLQIFEKKKNRRFFVGN